MKPEFNIGDCSECGIRRTTLDDAGLCMWCRPLTAAQKKKLAQPKGPKLPRRVRQAMARAYLRGMSLPGVAREAGYAISTVQAVLYYDGVPRRQAGQPDGAPVTGEYHKALEEIEEDKK